MTAKQISRLRTERRSLERNITRMNLKDAYNSIERIKRIDVQLDKQLVRDVAKQLKRKRR